MATSSSLHTMGIRVSVPGHLVDVWCVYNMQQQLTVNNVLVMHCPLSAPLASSKQLAAYLHNSVHLGIDSFGKFVIAKLVAPPAWWTPFSPCLNGPHMQY